MRRRSPDNGRRQRGRLEPFPFLGMLSPFSGPERDLDQETGERIEGGEQNKRKTDRRQRQESDWLVGFVPWALLTTVS